MNHRCPWKKAQVEKCIFVWFKLPKYKFWFSVLYTVFVLTYSILINKSMQLRKLPTLKIISYVIRLNGLFVRFSLNFSLFDGHPHVIETWTSNFPLQNTKMNGVILMVMWLVCNSQNETVFRESDVARLRCHQSTTFDKGCSQCKLKPSVSGVHPLRPGVH